MRRVVILVPLLAFATGCALAQKPYADDPLVRGGRAVWSGRDLVPRAPEPPPLITPPPAPPLPAPPAVTSPKRD